MEVCACCHDSLAAPLVVRLPVCGHQFHETCMDTWMQRSGTCPLCRAKVSDVVLLPAHDAATAKTQLETYRSDRARRRVQLEREVDAFRTTHKRRVDDCLLHIRRMLEMEVAAKELLLRTGADLAETTRLSRLALAVQMFPHERQVIERDQVYVQDQLNDGRRRLAQVVGERDAIAKRFKIS